MLASMMRNGTSRHLEPDYTQFAGLLDDVDYNALEMNEYAVDTNSLPKKFKARLWGNEGQATAGEVVSRANAHVMAVASLALTLRRKPSLLNYRADSQGLSMKFHRTPAPSLRRLLARNLHWNGSRVKLLGMMSRTEWELGQLYALYWRNRDSWGRTDRATLLAQYQQSPIRWRCSTRGKWKKCLLGYCYRMLLFPGWPVPVQTRTHNSSVFTTPSKTVIKNDP